MKLKTIAKKNIDFLKPYSCKRFGPPFKLKNKNKISLLQRQTATKVHRMDFH
jgi:hypothetical protein